MLNETFSAIFKQCEPSEKSRKFNMHTTEFSQVATISVNPSLLFNGSVAMPLFLFSLPLLAPFWLNSMHFNSFVVHTRSPAKKHIHPEGFPTIPHQPLSFRFPPFQASTKNLDVYIECTNGPLKPR